MQFKNLLRMNYTRYLLKTHENISSDLTNRWSRDTILFGESPGDWPKGWIKSTRYAKWAIDNWDGAQDPEDFDDRQ